MIVFLFFFFILSRSPFFFLVQNEFYTFLHFAVWLLLVLYRAALCTYQCRGMYNTVTVCYFVYVRYWLKRRTSRMNRMDRRIMDSLTNMNKNVITGSSICEMWAPRSLKTPDDIFFFLFYLVAVDYGCVIFIFSSLRFHLDFVVYLVGILWRCRCLICV